MLHVVLCGIDLFLKSLIEQNAFREAAVQEKSIEQNAFANSRLIPLAPMLN